MKNMLQALKAKARDLHARLSYTRVYRTGRYVYILIRQAIKGGIAGGLIGVGINAVAAGGPHLLSAPLTPIAASLSDSALPLVGTIPVLANPVVLTVAGLAGLVWGVDMLFTGLFGDIDRTTTFVRPLATLSWLGDKLGALGRYAVVGLSKAFTFALTGATFAAVSVNMLAYRAVTAVGLALQTPYMAFEAPSLVRPAWGMWLRSFSKDNFFTTIRPVFHMHLADEIVLPYVPGYVPEVVEEITEKNIAEQPKGRPTPRQRKHRSPKPVLV